MKTKEELNTIKEEVETVNKKLHELTEEELEKVTGGIDDSKCVILTSLEGVHSSDTQGHFQYNGIVYQCTGMKCSDSQGNLCYMFVAEGGGSMILLPQ